MRGMVARRKSRGKPMLRWKKDITESDMFGTTRGGPCQHGLMLCVGVGYKQWSNGRPLYA